MNTAKKNLFQMFAVTGTTTLINLAVFLIGGRVADRRENNFAYINNPDSVTVCFKETEDKHRVAYYHIVKDSIFVSKQYDSVISHELKHAHNATVFAKTLNVCADEISAQCAEVLYIAEKCCTKNTLSKFGCENMWPKRLARNVNYDIPILNQELIDYLLSVAIIDWNAIKPAYGPQRMASFCRKTLTTLSDEDLGKLFTFKINGVPRNLFNECSPMVRRRLRDECNAGSIAYLLQRPFVHTR